MQRRSLPILGVGALGVVVGHALAYFAALPAAGARQSLLSSTGHAYWSSAVFASLLMSLVAVGAVATLHFHAGRSGRSLQPLGYLPLAWRLAAVQGCIFGAMEVTERLAAGVPVATVFHSHLFLIGLAFQALVAAAAALLMGWLARAAKAVGALFRQTRHARPRSQDLPACTFAPRSRPLWDASRTRGPPLIQILNP